MRQPVQPPGSAETAGEAQWAGDRPGAEDRIPAVAHACTLCGRTARPLRTGEEEIHSFHVAHPALRRPGGASGPVSAAGTAGDRATAPGGRATHFRDRAKLQ